MNSLACMNNDLLLLQSHIELSIENAAVPSKIEHYHCRSPGNGALVRLLCRNPQNVFEEIWSGAANNDGGWGWHKIPARSVSYSTRDFRLELNPVSGNGHVGGFRVTSKRQPEPAGLFSSVRVKSFSLPYKYE